MPYSWIDPKDFEPKTRLYADDLDEIVNDLYYLREQIVALWPVGVAMQYPVAGALPASFLECDGTIYANTSWPALAAKLGQTWGGVAGASFAVPDYRGRAPIGAGQGAGLTNRALGTLLGVESYVQSVAQMAAHEHAHVHGFLSGGHSQSHWHGLGGHTHDHNHKHSYDHWHVASIGNVRQSGSANVAHTHWGHGGTVAEGSNVGDWGSAAPVNVTGTGGYGSSHDGTSAPNVWGTSGPSGGSDAADRDHTHSGTTYGQSASSMGGNASTSIMQPSAVTRYIIRAA